MWFNLISESFLANFVIPLGSEGVWFAWKSFGHPNLALATLAVTLTITAAFMVSYWLGWSFARQRDTLPISDEGYARFSRFMRRYGPFILAVQWIPLLSIFALLCGFARIGWHRVFIPVLLGRAAYYLVYLT